MKKKTVWIILGSIIGVGAAAITAGVVVSQTFKSNKNHLVDPIVPYVVKKTEIIADNKNNLQGFNLSIKNYKDSINFQSDKRGYIYDDWNYYSNGFSMEIFNQVRRPDGSWSDINRGRNCLVTDADMTGGMMAIDGSVNIKKDSSDSIQVRFDWNSKYLKFVPPLLKGKDRKWTIQFDIPFDDNGNTQNKYQTISFLDDGTFVEDN